VSDIQHSQTAENAAFARRAFGTDVPQVDAHDAFQAVIARGSAATRWRPAPFAFAAAACLAAALLLSPLGSYATQFLTIFEPKAFVPLDVTATDGEQLRLMPQLTTFGTFSSSPSKMRKVTSLSAAAALTGLTPRRLTNVPAASGAVHYWVVLPVTVSFTFSAAKARAYESRFHRRLPPMPRDLDGTTVRVAIGPAIGAFYGDAERVKKMHDVEDTVSFFQSKSPRVTSTGASMETLENYLLAMPNVPASVAKQLRAIADPANTLPIPVRIDKMTAQTVRVDGVDGLAIGDQTGLGSGVLWQKNGTLYAIAGPLKQSDVLAMANALR
jgi:hypothetical protein